MGNKKEAEVEEPDKLNVRNTRKVYIPLYFMAVGLLIVMIYIKASGRPLNDLALKIALIFSVSVLVYSEIHRFGNSYEINVNSVVHKKGYLSTVSKRAEFGAISDSDIKQTLWQRLFSYGDVEIHLYSKENKTVVKNISNPFGFVDFLEKKMSKHGGRQR